MQDSVAVSCVAGGLAMRVRRAARGGFRRWRV